MSGIANLRPRARPAGTRRPPHRSLRGTVADAMRKGTPFTVQGAEIGPGNFSSDAQAKLVIQELGAQVGDGPEYGIYWGHHGR